MNTEPTANQTRALRRIAGMMIPASERHGVPGADDDLIFADILRSFGQDAAQVVAFCADLDRRAGGVFADLDEATARRVAEQARTAGGTPLMMTQRVILQCYYRDDRVMLALGMEPRPPFPKGHVVEQGDWSLLDPVRARAPFYRDAPR
jgi:hypothetical protein